MNALTNNRLLALGAAFLLTGALSAQGNASEQHNPDRKSSDADKVSVGYDESQSQKGERKDADKPGVGYDESQSSKGERKDADKPGIGYDQSQSQSSKGERKDADKPGVGYDEGTASEEHNPDRKQSDDADKPGVGHDATPQLPLRSEATLSQSRGERQITLTVTPDDGDARFAAILLSFDARQCHSFQGLPPLLCNAAVLAAGFPDGAFEATIARSQLPHGMAVFAQGVLADNRSIQTTSVLNIGADVNSGSDG